MRLISWRLSGAIDVIEQPVNDITSLVEKGLFTYSIGSALEMQRMAANLRLIDTANMPFLDRLRGIESMC